MKIENRDGWAVYSAIIKDIKDYFALFPNANDVLNQTINQENDTINASAEVNLDFSDYPRENLDLNIGDIV